MMLPSQQPQPGTLPPTRQPEKPAEKPETTRPSERPTDQTQTQTPNPMDQEQASSAFAPPAGEGAGAGAGTGAEGGAAEGAEGGAGAGLGGGEAASSAGMLGRGDMNNRFNLFDNMSPYLANRVWFAYQFQESFNTGVLVNKTNPTVSSNFAPRRDVDLYRVGGEFVPFDHSCYAPNFSIAFQTQYVSSTNTADSADAWANPVAMLKLLMCESSTGAWSLTLGVQPQIASHDGELHEKSTRILPGFLFQQSLIGGLFVQGGMQMGISDRNDTNTLDYALSFGYWLYAAPQPCPTACCRPWLTGLVPQVEFYGANVVANQHSDPFELQGNPSVPNSSAPYQEPRNVYDLTAGGRILLRDSISIGTAYSFPLTGPSVRKSEFIASLNVFF
jgi:hypothetical protein